MPLILVTNDDGIQSPGINALADALEDVADLLVVAPSRQQSAVSHKITLGEPLRARAISGNRVAVSGTPADAVFIALHKICPRQPDLVVSGINLGTNMGTDLFYSGTLAGALEAALKGIPSIALSQQLPVSPPTPPQEREDAQKANIWDPIRRTDRKLTEVLHNSAHFAAELVRFALKHPMPPGTVLNVNAPNQVTSSFCWTRVGGRVYRGEVIERIDPRGIPYYWIGGPVVEQVEPAGTDARAVHDGQISISPIGLDWNAARPMEWVQLAVRGFREHQL